MPARLSVLRPAALIAASLALCATGASAATVAASTTFSDSESFTNNSALTITSPNPGALPGHATIAGFDPKLGTLDSITVSRTIGTTINASTTRVGVTDWTYAVIFDVNRPFDGIAADFNALDFDDSIFDSHEGNSQSFHPYDAVSFSETDGPVFRQITDPSVFASFEQPTIQLNTGLSFVFQTIPFVFSPTGQTFPATPPNDVSENSTETLTLIYNYTPMAAVPEPATWAMMLVGFGGLGAALRTRRAESPILRSASK